MADPSLDEMMGDLAAADAAGDTELAQRIAGKIKAAQGPEPVSRLEAAARAVSSIGTGGWGTKMYGLRSASHMSDFNVPTIDPATRFREARKQAERDAQAIQEHPAISLAVGAPIAALSLPLGGPAKSAPLLAKALYAAKAGAALGGYSGLGNTSANTVGGVLADTAIGASGGGLLSFAAPYAGAGAKSVAKAAAGETGRAGQALLRLLTPKISPTAEAQRLTKAGIPLTTGQLQPNSYVNALEQASAHGAGGMAPEREAAVDAWRQTVMKQPLAPGQTLPGGGTAEQLEGIYQGFGPQYAPIKAAPVPAGALDGLSGQALASPRGIDARTKEAAAAEIRNALTVLPENASGSGSSAGHGHGHGPAKPAAPSIVDPYGRAIETPPAPSKPTTVKELLKVRENLREQLRAAQKSQDWDRMRILGHAADTVTESIDSALSPELQAANRATDARYRTFNIIEDAANRSGLSGDFTPKQLGASLKAAEGRRSFSQGGGGNLRSLADDAAAVFTPTVQPTGEKATVTNWIPKWAASPLARAANTQPIRDAMLRAPLPARQSYAGSLSPETIARQVRTLSPQARQLLEALGLRQPFGFGLPVFADEEGRE